MALMRPDCRVMSPQGEFIILPGLPLDIHHSHCLSNHDDHENYAIVMMMAKAMVTMMIINGDYHDHDDHGDDHDHDNHGHDHDDHGHDHDHDNHDHDNHDHDNDDHDDDHPHAYEEGPPSRAPQVTHCPDRPEMSPPPRVNAIQCNTIQCNIVQYNEVQ